MRVGSVFSDRRTARIAARLVVEEGHPLSVLLTNLSRGGCRLEPTPLLKASVSVRVEVDGWPRLQGRVVWSDGGRSGCIFDPRPSEQLYERMAERTTADERFAP